MTEKIKIKDLPTVKSKPQGKEEMRKQYQRKLFGIPSFGQKL